MSVGGEQVPEWPDVECPVHGLPGGASFPPMDRHARTVEVEEPHLVRRRDGSVVDLGPRVVSRLETAAEVQRRLYGEARG